MAVIVITETPGALLRSMKEAMRNGNVDTWSVDSDGDFTHTPAQWNKKAWFRPAVEEGRLVCRILTPQGQTMSRVVYGIYHGRFIEMLLTHFDTMFEDARATALAQLGDVVG